MMPFASIFLMEQTFPRGAKDAGFLPILKYSGKLNNGFPPSRFQIDTNREVRFPHQITGNVVVSYVTGELHRGFDLTADFASRTGRKQRLEDAEAFRKTADSHTQIMNGIVGCVASRALCLGGNFVQKRGDLSMHEFRDAHAVTFFMPTLLTMMGRP